TKPRIPPECGHLHYLLATPFRYGAIYPTGSRFRRAGMSDGVFYAADEAETALAEVTFHRLLFFADSPATPWPANPAEYTAFAISCRTKACIDLTRGRFRAQSGAWLHPTDYAPCQALAEAARAAAIEVIRYRSVRAPAGRMNVAILTCRAFARPEPVAFRTWRIHLSASGAQAVCEAPRQGLAFGRDSFAADPRIAALRWER